MAPAKGEAKEGKGSPTKKRKMKSPSKAAPVEFDWSAELIEECMLRGDSGAHLAKYCGSNEQITGDGTAPVTLPGKYVAAGEPAFLPLKCFLDGALEETVAKRFAALSDEAKLEHGAFALAYPPGADPSKISEWRECVVAGGFRDDGDAYELTWTGGDRGTCARDCAAVVFKWQDLAEAVARLTRALRRRRECEALLKVRHHIRCMPVMDRVVVLPKREQWDRLLGVALSLKPFDGPGVKAHALRGVAEAHVFGTPWLGPEEDRVPVVEPELDELDEADLPRVRSILALVDEAVADYEAVMNEIVFVSDKLNVANYSSYLQLMLPAPPPRAPPPPRLGVVATPPHDFPRITVDFRSATFLDSVEVVQALTDTQMHAIAIHDLKILSTEHAAPQSPDEFTTAQTAAVAAALRTLKEQWVQRTAASIRQDLATADRSVYNLEEGAMASYSRPDNKLYLLLKRINYVMTHELFLVTFESLTNYTNYVVDACKGQVTVNSTSDVECVYPDRKADEPPRMPPLFFMTVIITPEKRVLNQPAVDARNAKIAEWHKSDEGKEEGAECPSADRARRGPDFDYETPLSQMESCVASAFRHAIKELRAIPHVQRYIMERLFWPRPEMIGAVTGEKVADFNGVETYREDERWIGDLEESFVTAVRAAIDPARTYLDCFHQWEDFLNLEVDEYVAGLTHAQLNDEEVEEGEEPDAPPVKVNLVVLKATLNTHREEKARVEAMIPGRPLSAGLCMLNAAALRDELANKHMAIMQSVLATHADHCS
ncbi:dynein light chain binding protein [Aureococcus anophagefferens]|nr:dynein light chain binding protein [Aureococcus anophagefferens]